MVIPMIKKEASNGRCKSVAVSFMRDGLLCHGIMLHVHGCWHFWDFPQSALDDEDKAYLELNRAAIVGLLSPVIALEER